MKTKTIALWAVSVLLGACDSSPDDIDLTTSAQGLEDIHMDSGSSKDRMQEDFIKKATDRVHFELNSSDLTKTSRAIIKGQSTWLKQNPDVFLTLHGHCDERGTSEYNMALGYRRASAARDALISEGIEGNRISVISHGKDKPLIIGSNEEAWRQNRVAVTICETVFAAK